MTQYNVLNVKLSNSRLSKLKSAIKHGIGVTLSVSSNVAGSCNNKNNLLHKLLLTNTHVSTLRKAFENNSLANIKLSKAQLCKKAQSGEFLGRLFRT